MLPDGVVPATDIILRGIAGTARQAPKLDRLMAARIPLYREHNHLVPEQHLQDQTGTETACLPGVLLMSGRFRGIVFRQGGSGITATQAGGMLFPGRPCHSGSGPGRINPS